MRLHFLESKGVVSLAKQATTQPLRIDVSGLAEGDRALREFAAGVEDWRPFWRELGEHLADEAQSRWPLRRRTGRLRKSLTWAGGRLGPGGIFESSADRLEFGTNVFYSRFAQYGTKRQRQRTLLHVDETAIGQRLGLWAKSRAAASGLEVA